MISLNIDGKESIQVLPVQAITQALHALSVKMKYAFVTTEK